MKLAKEGGVTGVAEWFHHEQISIGGDLDIISHLRRGMIFVVSRKLSRKASWVDGGADSSRASRITSLRGRSRSGVGRLTGSGISPSTTISSSGRKRKRDARLEEGSRLKRSKSDSSHNNAANVYMKGSPDISNAYSVQEAVTDSLADCRNKWQLDNAYSTQEAGANSLIDYENRIYDNQVHYCLVSSPAGRPLHTYRSVKELLEALRDAIAGHRSLLEDGRILHRDISENNIIITDHAVEGDPIGRLIDHDLVKELDGVPSGASHRTGTMQFMAIDVLQGKGHTYRHDLESMFYAFIWMCIRYGHDEVEGEFKPNNRRRPAKISRLRGWYTGTYAEIARIKVGDMNKDGYGEIIAEFTPTFVE